MSGKVPSQTAFVLMKFVGDPWNDPTYQVICQVVTEAGYQPLRADEIRTSGPVVDEVCRQIREVPLLIIDTSSRGAPSTESHSVSYELGYAHGFSRSYDGTIVLRSKESGSSPFNYAHFRQHIYRNRSHLRRLLRNRLQLSTPLRNDQLAYTLCFSVMPNADAYGDSIAATILDVLKSLRFSGRCEYFAGEPFIPGEHFYMVGLGLKTPSGDTPDCNWWARLCKFVSHHGLEQKANVVLNAELSEIGELGG